MFFRICFALLFLYGAAQANEQNINLPKNHPVHRKLDRLFAHSRPLLSLEALIQAGFVKAKPRKFTHLIVTRHPAMPGYIFKLYLDPQRYPKGESEDVAWRQRIAGAEKIRKMIRKNNWERVFKVPRKWIYTTPKTHLDKDYPCKLTLLVEEDMDLASSKKNRLLWKAISPKRLHQLQQILQTIGLRDCAKPDNIPFSRDGKIAFIDTQSRGEESVAYKKLLPYLRPPMKVYWKKLNRR